MKITIFLLPLTTLAGDRLKTRHLSLNAQTRLWAALCLASLLTTATPPAQAAVTEAWVHRYGNVVSNSNDQAVKVVRDTAGDIIVTGTTDEGITGWDMLTIKYSGADGSVIWQKRYNGPASDYAIAGSLAVDLSGNVVVTGYFYGSESYDFYTAKYAAADGALLWEKRQNTRSGRHAFASAVAVDGTGNVVVTGTSYGSTSYDYYTAKYAAEDGALLWEQRYDGPANKTDEAGSLAVDGTGNVVVTGRSVGSGGNDDYYTAKYAAADGALLWERRYNSPANSTDQASAVAVDGSGNVFVTGTSFNGTNSDSNSDYYTAKYAVADGALLWERRYNGPANNNDEARAVAVDASGNVVVTGTSVGSGLTYGFYTAKYAAADGRLLWEKRHNGPANSYDAAYALAVDGSGNVLVTGSSGVIISENGGQLVSDYYTAKYAAANGALLWEKRYDGLGNSDDGAQAVAVDDSGNVVVTGVSDYDYYTAKYAAANGALLWEQRYNGPFHGDAQANAVAVDGSGNVVVTGSANHGAPNFDADYYTAKYAAADGALLWEQRYNGSANSDDRAQAVAVDGNGNVVVTGFSTTPNLNWPERQDYYTAKYAAANGALLWERRYNAGYGQARVVAVDGSGNVMVTGGTGLYGFERRLAFYTAKYAAADGAPLWEQRYGGPNGYGTATNGYGSAVDGSEGAAAMAIDGSGNVVVTGTCGYDYYTAKYANANGALLWERRYTGPAAYPDEFHNRAVKDRSQAVAVDHNGNVVVTGISANRELDGPDPYDYYTAKYAAADGALLWEKRYGGPANLDFQSSSVAVDGDGNVVAAATSGYGAYLAKYAAADGALLWEKRYNGPWFDQTQAVAVDGSGNVVVTGTFNTGFPTYAIDYYTAKYAAVGGALLWEKGYNGPLNGDDRVGCGRSLAVSPNGMVAVTGSSSGNFATVVYRENLLAVSIAPVPAGIRIRFTGVPGRSYTIERALGVTGPWSTLTTPTAPPAGLIEYVDTNPPTGTAFYRTTLP